MKNGDVLRSMSDEKLAEQLVICVKGLEPCTVYLSAPTGKMFISRTVAVDTTFDWIQQEEQNTQPEI